MSDEPISKDELLTQTQIVHDALLEFFNELSAKHPELRTMSVGISLLAFGTDMYATAMREQPRAYMENIVTVAASAWMHTNPDIPIPNPPEDA